MYGHGTGESDNPPTVTQASRSWQKSLSPRRHLGGQYGPTIGVSGPVIIDSSFFSHGKVAWLQAGMRLADQVKKLLP
jgi:hypothetical protein